jgi:hypothetical protein
MNFLPFMNPGYVSQQYATNLTFRHQKQNELLKLGENCGCGVKGQKMKRHTCNKGGNPSRGLETREHISQGAVFTGLSQASVSLWERAALSDAEPNRGHLLHKTERHKLHPGARNTGLTSTFRQRAPFEVKYSIHLQVRKVI